MLLALDIGNTTIVVGVFTGDQLVHSWRLSTQRQRTADEMGMWALQLFQHGRLAPADVDGVVLASVVPTPLMAVTISDELQGCGTCLIVQRHAGDELVA